MKKMSLNNEEVAFYLAVKKGEIEKASALKQKYQEGINIHKCFEHIVGRKELPAAKLLLTHFHVNVNEEIRDAFDHDSGSTYTKTLLHIAVENGDKNMVELLLKQPGIDIHIPTKTYRPSNDDDGEYAPGFYTRPGHTAIDIATSVEIKELFKQKLKVEDVIKQSKTIERDSAGEKLAKFFNAYAHPPLLSLNWRSGHLQKVADKIATELSKNKGWTTEQCLDYIQTEVNKIDPAKINPSGTFQGLLMEVEKMRPQSQNFSI